MAEPGGAGEHGLHKGIHLKERILRTADDDDAIELYQEISTTSNAEFAEASRKVRFKIDMYVLIPLCLIYVLQFSEKVSLNYAAAFTLIPDLGLTGNKYSWTASIFNFGYLISAYPSNLALQKFPVAKVLGINIVLWGILMMCHAAVKNFAGLMVLRFFLGCSEACVSPGNMLITSVFYTRQEQPLRFSIWLGCNGLASMIVSLVSFGLGHVTSAAVPSWALIFLVIGALTFVYGIGFLIYMPDSPKNARFLTEREKAIAIHRIAVNGTGVKNIKVKKYQIYEALLDPKLYFLAMFQLAVGIINGGVTNFSTSLIKGFGYDGIMATLLNLPGGAIELVFVPLAGYLASTMKNARFYITVILILPCIAGLIGIRVVSLEHQMGLVACTWFQGLIGGTIILSWSFSAANIAGHTKRTVVNGTVFGKF